VYRNAGNKLIIRVNPAKIDGYVGGNIPMMDLMENRLFNRVPKIKLIGQRAAFHLGPFAIPGRLYKKPVKLERMEKYKKVKDLIEHSTGYLKSLWYNDMLRELETVGAVKHKEITLCTVEELNNFFESYVLELVNSMKKNGYMESKCSQIGNVTIGKKGELHKSNAGDHRFITARILGIKCMPFKVNGVHKEWFNNKSILNRRRGISKLVSAIREVEEENR
jgi:hypothetical protein